MWQYLVKRLFLLVVTLIGICLVSFLLVALSPGDPASTAAGMGPAAGGSKGRATDEVLKNIRETLYLDRPVVLNFSPNSRSKHALRLVKDICEGSDYARQDAQGEILSGTGTAGLEVFIEEAEKRCGPATETAKRLEAAVTALDGVAKNDSATPVDLDAAVKAVQAVVPGRGPRIARHASPLVVARTWASWGHDHLDEPFSGIKALLDTLDALVPEATGGPGGKGTPAERAHAWSDWWKKNADRYTTASIDKTVNAYLDAPGAGDSPDVKARLADVQKIGAACTATLMDAYHSSSGERHRRAAFGMSLVAHRPWDLTITPATRGEIAKEWAEKKIGGDKDAWVEKQVAARIADEEKSIARWWFRSEEEYTEFSSARQLGRAFTQTQFGHWFRGLFKLDFGRSFALKKDVWELIVERFPKSAWLNFFSIMLTYMIAIPMGVYSATHQKSMGDRISTVVLFILYSLPSFWVGSILLLFLTGKPTGIALFPYRGYEDMNAATFDGWHQFTDWIWHITLPVLCLTYGGIAYVSRQMRGGMLEVIRQDYIRTARAKGLSENVVVFKHAMRNSLIPIITIVAFLLPAMFGGSVIIESIFSIEGLGKLMFEAIPNRDYPLIMAEVFISGVLTLFGILIGDICYAIVDPRIELK